MLASIFYTIASFLAKAACVIFVPLFFIGLFIELRK